MSEKEKILTEILEESPSIFLFNKNVLLRKFWAKEEGSRWWESLAVLTPAESILRTARILTRRHLAKAKTLSDKLSMGKVDEAQTFMEVTDHVSNTQPRVKLVKKLVRFKGIAKLKSKRGVKVEFSPRGRTNP